MLKNQSWEDKLYDRLEPQVGELKVIVKNKVETESIKQFAKYLEVFSYRLLKLISLENPEELKLLGDSIHKSCINWNHTTKGSLWDIRWISVYLQNNKNKTNIDEYLSKLSHAAGITISDIEEINSINNFPETDETLSNDFKSYIIRYFWDILPSSIRYNVEDGVILDINNRKLFNWMRDLARNNRKYWEEWLGTIDVALEGNYITFTLGNKKNKNPSKDSWGKWLWLLKDYFGDAFTYDYSQDDCRSRICIPIAINTRPTWQVDGASSQDSQVKPQPSA